MTITCFGPVFIGLKMGFPILSNYLYRHARHLPAIALAQASFRIPELGSGRVGFAFRRVSDSPEFRNSETGTRKRAGILDVIMNIFSLSSITSPSQTVPALGRASNGIMILIPAGAGSV